MKLVITGALGNIGSYLIERLLTFRSYSHQEFILFDNRPLEENAHLKKLLETHAKSFQFHQESIWQMSIDKFQSSLAGSSAVIHLAAQTQAAASFHTKTKDELIRNNSSSTNLVANACLKAKIPLLFISTASVYGPKGNWIDENCPPEELRPQSPYAEAKLLEEKLLENLGATLGLHYTIYRFATVFGRSSGMNFHTAINKFCWQASKGIPLTVWETAYHQKRPYLDIEDATSAILFILQNQIFHNQVYNVNSGNYTVCQIIELLKKYRPPLSLSFEKDPSMNELSYEVSNKKLRDLGFEFKGDLEKGIKETLAFLESVPTKKA